MSGTQQFSHVQANMPCYLTAVVDHAICCA